MDSTPAGSGVTQPRNPGLLGNPQRPGEGIDQDQLDPGGKKHPQGVGGIGAAEGAAAGSPRLRLYVITLIPGASPLRRGWRPRVRHCRFPGVHPRRHLDGSRQSEGDQGPGEVADRAGSANALNGLPFSPRAGRRQTNLVPGAGRCPASSAAGNRRPGGTPRADRPEPFPSFCPSASERASAAISRRLPRSCTSMRTPSRNALRLCASNRKPVSPLRTMSTTPDAADERPQASEERRQHGSAPGRQQQDVVENRFPRPAAWSRSRSTGRWRPVPGPVSLRTGTGSPRRSRGLPVCQTPLRPGRSIPPGP